MSGIPHKGALAFGKMTQDYNKSIFFGQPLIDAYLLQEELMMYGIIIHSSAEFEIEKLQISKELFLFNYQCPFKGRSSHYLTIPPIFADEGSIEEKYREYQEKLVQGIKEFRNGTSEHPRKYLDNTEAFLRNYNPNLL